MFPAAARSVCLTAPSLSPPALARAAWALHTGGVRDAAPYAAVAVEAGGYFESAQDLEDVVVAVRGGRAVLLKDVASLKDGAPPASSSCA